MPHIRPIRVFGALVLCMNVWLSTRMMFSTSLGVWRVSSVLGAWLPLFAAGLFLYVRAVGDREDSVVAAWFVRTLGVQSVLAWGVGVNDWLRGPPNTPPMWNTDVGGPFVLVGFALPFVAGVGTMLWFGSVARRLRVAVERPEAPGAGQVGVAPFRGTAMNSARPAEMRLPVAPALVAALGSAVALESPGPAYWVLFASALPLAALTARNARALWPSVATFAWVAAVITSRSGSAGGASAVSAAVAWPWVTASAVVLYLVAIEGLLRTRALPERAGARR